MDKDIRSVNGKVEISVEDYEYLRSIERNLPVVRINYCYDEDNRLPGVKVPTIKTEGDVLKECEAAFKKLLDERDNFIAIQKRKIDEDCATISCLKSKLVELENSHNKLGVKTKNKSFFAKVFNFKNWSYK